MRVMWRTSPSRDLPLLEHPGALFCSLVIFMFFIKAPIGFAVMAMREREKEGEEEREREGEVEGEGRGRERERTLE